MARMKKKSIKTGTTDTESDVQPEDNPAPPQAEPPVQVQAAEPVPAQVEPVPTPEESSVPVEPAGQPEDEIVETVETPGAVEPADGATDPANYRTLPAVGGLLYLV